jgi:hypothetical protein
MSLGGLTYGEPVLAKHSDGRLEIFAFGTDGHLFRKAQAGPNQPFVSDWTPFSTDFQVFLYSEEVLFDPLTTRISWALHQNRSMYIFARTVRGRIVFAHTGVPTGFSDWKSISAIQDGHPAMGSPAATSAPTASSPLFLCVRAKNSAVLSKTLGSSVDDWGDPNRWDNHGGITSAEPVVGTERIGSTVLTSVYGRGTDNNLYWIGESVTTEGSLTHGVPFGEWQGLFNDSFPGAKLSGHPVITTPSGGVVWRGINGNLWSMGQRSFGVFSGPVDLGFASASDPAVTISNGTSWMFWQSPNGQLMMQRRLAGGSPESPVSLTSGLGVRVISKPSASTSADGRAAVIFVGSDSAVYHLRETAVGSGTFVEGT